MAPPKISESGRRGRRGRTLSAIVAGLFIGISGPASASAQAPPEKDDALEKLLEEIDSSKDGAGLPDEKPNSETPAPVEPSRPEESAEDAAERDRGKVAPSDEALDSLLEKLGAAEDEPDTQAKPEPKPAPTDEQLPRPEDESKPGPGSGPEEPKQGQLDGDAKRLDEHLQELTGRRPKRGDRDRQQGEGQGQGKEGEGGGPLGEVTKRMREVERRLGQRDTGEQTRQRQAEIVKQFDQLIEQMRATQSKSQGKPEKQLAQGQPKPGDKPGQQPGANARGVDAQMPSRPETRRADARGKDEWGHLSPQMRAEMENTFKEDPLPAREELIKRYYTSVAKKALAREE